MKKENIKIIPFAKLFSNLMRLNNNWMCSSGKVWVLLINLAI